MANVVCTIPNREDLEDEHREMLYYSRSDYHMSRSTAKVISKESERYGFSKNLDDTFAEKSKGAQENLNLWSSHGHMRRGLERWSNREHGDTRQQDQFQTIMAVLRAQDDLLLKSKHADVEKLRRVSHKSTRTARHFARMLGKADSFALSNDGNGSDDISVATEAMGSVSLSVSTHGTNTTSSTCGTTVTEGSDDTHSDSLKDSPPVRTTKRGGLFKFGRKNREAARENNTIDDARGVVSRGE